MAFIIKDDMGFHIYDPISDDLEYLRQLDCLCDNCKYKGKCAAVCKPYVDFSISPVEESLAYCYVCEDYFKRDDMSHSMCPECLKKLRKLIV